LRRIERAHRGAPAALFVALLLAAAAPASADTFTVDRGDDADVSGCSAATGDCTLRGALNRANAGGGPDTIVLPAQRLAVESPLPRIEGTLTIAGAGARSSIIDATASVGTVLASGFGSNTTLEDLQVTGARRVPHNGDAAIAGATRVERVAILDNESTGLASFGGMTVVDSLIARNTGEGVGGVIASAGATTLSNSTVADNTAVAGDSGLLTGPLVFGGGVVNAAALLEIDHSTITGNRVAAGAVLLTGANLGSIAQLDPSTVVRSSVIGGSSGPSCGGPIDSNGHNIDADGSCHFGSAGDRSHVDPRLAGLADNGGPTDTIALLSGSPAIDAGDACPASDQRGASRAQGMACDAGALESPFTAPSPTATPDPTATPVPPRDTTAPRLAISGIKRTLRRASVRAGLKIRVGADEAIGAELELLVAPRRVTIARVPDLALGRLSLPLRAGARTVTLKPRRALSGGRPIPAQLRVVAYDAAGNRAAKTIAFTIR
jgi:hypothetical protein